MIVLIFCICFIIHVCIFFLGFRRLVRISFLKLKSISIYHLRAHFYKISNYCTCVLEMPLLNCLKALLNYVSSDTAVLQILLTTLNSKHGKCNPIIAIFILHFYIVLQRNLTVCSLEEYHSKTLLGYCTEIFGTALIFCRDILHETKFPKHSVKT